MYFFVRYGDYDDYEGGYGMRGGVPGDRAGRNMVLGQQEGCVLMVYNMDANKMNCQKLFNLFCLYGNVAKVCIYCKKSSYATYGN